MLDFLKKLFTPPPPLTKEQEDSLKEKTYSDLEKKKLSLSREKYKKTIRNGYLNLRSSAEKSQRSGFRERPDIKIALEIYRAEHEKLEKENY